MGRIFKRGKVYYTDVVVNGQRLRRRAGSNKRLAEQKLHDLELKIGRGELGFKDLAEKPIGIAEFFAKVESYSRTNHRPETVKRYASAYKNFQSYLKKVYPDVSHLAELTSEIVEGFKTFRKSVDIAANGKSLERAQAGTRKKGARTTTINFETRTLRTAFYLAIRWGYLKENPARDVRILKVDDKSERMFLSVEECNRLLSACTEELYPLVFTFLQTGMRSGELVHLEWEDVDFSARRIKIRPKKDWQPKTGSREIPMTNELVAMLRQLPRKDRRVFIRSDGRKWHSNRVREQVGCTARKAGLKGFSRVHDLRHTFISLLNKESVDLPTIQKLAGHRRIETTMGYTHIHEKHLDESIAKLPIGSPKDPEVIKLPASA